jgi:hypothetical protein
MYHLYMILTTFFEKKYEKHKPLLTYILHCLRNRLYLGLLYKQYKIYII